MKRVLITGVTGYIGSHLARALLSDCEVYGLVREPLSTEYIADIKEKLHLLQYDGSYESVERAMRESAPDVVYHLATYYTGAHNADVTTKMLAANVMLGGYLLEAMCACGCRSLVYATSIMTHYQGEEYRPLNLYAATKQALSDLIAYYTDAGLLRAVTLVLSDTYGPDDRRPKILNLIRKAAESGEHIALSDGTQDYDVVHIDDVVRAFRMAGERAASMTDGSELYQVCAEHPLTLRETVEKMLAVNGMTLDAGWGERAPSEREQRRAIRLYPTLSGWQQEVSLETGLRSLCFAGKN